MSSSPVLFVYYILANFNSLVMFLFACLLLFFPNLGKLIKMRGRTVAIIVAIPKKRSESIDILVYVTLDTCVGILSGHKKRFFNSGVAREKFEGTFKININLF